MYTVALEADEVHCHWDGAVAVPVQGLDVVQQVCKELVAPFEDAEGHDVVPPHFLHNLSGQSLCPGITCVGERERERGGGGCQLSFLLQSAVVSISFLCLSAG